MNGNRGRLCGAGILTVIMCFACIGTTTSSADAGWGSKSRYSRVSSQYRYSRYQKHDQGLHRWVNHSGPIAGNGGKQAYGGKKARKKGGKWRGKGNPRLATIYRESRQPGQSFAKWVTYYYHKFASYFGVR